MNLASVQHETENLLEHAAERWRTCEGTSECDLLRLSILRDLAHDLHAEKSRFLAQGKRDPATQIRQIESRMDDLKNCKPLSGDLLTLVSGSEKLKKRTRLLPDALFTNIDREKLERYDRQWEAALASEAVFQGWRIWAIEAWVQIARVDEWNKRLVDQLWPHGIVLFAESVREPSDATDSEPDSGNWFGRWICVLHPKFRNPTEMSLDFGKWPGTQSTPSWRLLFSPKNT